jgi:hypothetical protein
MDDDSANPDHEILNAVRPAMATIPGALMLCASSPYAKRGALYDAHRRYFGKARLIRRTTDWCRRNLSRLSTACRMLSLSSDFRRRWSGFGPKAKC